MGRRKTSLVVVIALTCHMAHGADQDELNESNVKLITESVNLLGDCAGYFSFIAEIFQAKQPATARQMKDTANGARMAAAYLLSIEHIAKGNKPKKIGEFLIYPEGREQAAINRLQALLEQGDKDQLKTEQQRCLDALPMQDDIVQRMRNDMVGR